MNLSTNEEQVTTNESDNRCKAETKARQPEVTDCVTLSLSFLAESLVLGSASVLVTKGSMRWYLQPNQIAQAFQLL